MAIVLNFAGTIGQEEGHVFITLSDQSGSEYRWFPTQEVIDSIAHWLTPSGYVNRYEVRKVARQAQTHFMKSQSYAKEGDWAKFGAQLKRLRAAIERIVKISTSED